MKTILTIFLLSVSVISAQAVVRIVDNNGNRPAGTIYETFNSAQTAASNGDTLLITPSTATYGTITISKSITVLGVGFNPDKSTGAKSTVDNITIANGVSNVNISGLVVNTLISIGQSNAGHTMSNIVIEKCQLDRIASVGTSAPTFSNIIIRQNLFYPSLNFNAAVTMNVNNQSNIIISNNIFSSSDSRIYGGVTSTSGGLLIDQNIFFGPGTVNQIAFSQLVNSVVTNNIFYGRNPINNAGSTTSVTFNNNFIFGNGTNTIPSITGYTVSNNQTVDPQFEEMPVGVYDFTKDVTIQTGSPALTAGEGGGEVGVYGGSTPYKNTGVSIPVVKTLTLPTAIKENTNTSATISVNGN
jgi:hypothetical protein